MSSLVSLVLNQTEKLPIVGHWYFKNNEKTSSDQPPPYEKVIAPSNLMHISDYVWKKSSSNTKESAAESILDKGQIEEGVSLIRMATQVNHHESKNQEISINLYMMGLDKILASLPIDSDPLIKSSLESKLTDFKERNNLVLPNLDRKQKLTHEQKEKALSGLSSLIIQAAVQSAIALKKSPFPSLIAKLIQVAKIGLVKVDETCLIKERAIRISQVGLAKAIELDEHYEVHQFLAELFYTGCAALLKANAAYQEEESDKST
ncbi:unnamed protein product [Rhizopus stolonifer]